MGNRLFGNDIAGRLNRAFSGKVLKGTLNKLTKGTRTTGELTAGPSQSFTSSTFNGFFEDATTRTFRGTAIEAGDRIVAIFGDSLSAVPAVGDTIELENETFQVVGQISRDPDAALYFFKVRGGV